MVEDSDLGAESHDQTDIMFDEQDGFAIRLNSLKEVSEPILFGGIHARCRLIEGQQFGLSGQGPRNLKAALVPVGEGGCSLMLLIAKADIIEQGPCRINDGLLVLDESPGSKDGAPNSCMEAVAADVPPHHDIFKGSEVPEESNVLECPRDARPGDLVHGLGSVLDASNFKPTRIRRIEPCDEVKEGGLASAVWTNQSIDLLVLDF